MEIVYTDGLSPDFVSLCSKLDDFMMNFKDVDKASYHPYGSHENIHDAFVAYQDGIPVGCAAYRKQSDGVAELKRVFVMERYRGRGISKVMLDAVEKKAKENGFHTMTLGTLSSLAPAVNLYHGRGYKEISVESLYVCMSKQLY